MRYFVEFVGETWSYSSPASWLSHPFHLPVSQHYTPAIHPLICPSRLFFLGFLSVRKLQYSLQRLSFSLTLSVTCRPEKLLALILYLSAVATVSGFPAPTNSFISDLQRKTWETLSHAHTHDSTPAHKTHTHTQKYTTHAPPRQISNRTHIRTASSVFLALAGAAVHRCTHADMRVCNLVNASKHVCKGETHTQSCINTPTHTLTHSHRLSASRNCDDDEWLSSKDWDRTRIFFITRRCTA